MTDEETTSHLVSYPDIKEPQKPLTEKHASPRKAAVLNFNPDGSLCIPADLKEKLVHQPTKGNTSNRQNTGTKENVTPDSRKRKKNNAPTVWVPPPQDCCHFCYTKDVSKKLGELKDVDGILAHHSCLLFSSGLVQAGNNEEGLWGFLTPNIKKELSRGKRLTCSFCRLPGALVGCNKARCSYTYHLTCGLSNGCLMQYYDNFRSFCDSHRPRQNFLEEMMGKTVECAICGDMISVESKVVPQQVIVTECCNMTPFHRDCIQNQADASGYFFRCPMCNNEKKFNNIMKIMGINIPLSDAVWEKDGYYDDLYVEHWRCDVPICLHPDGRKGDSRNNDKWDLMKCVTCGQAGAHPYCLGHEKRGPKDWSCGTCVTIESKYAAERLEEEKKKPAEPAKRTKNLSLDQEAAGPSNVNSSTGSTTSKLDSFRRPRGKNLTTDQIAVLEKYYQKAKFVDTAMMERIEAESGNEILLSSAESWFSKQRKKEFHKTGIAIKRDKKPKSEREVQVLEEYYQQNHFLEPETMKEILTKLDIPVYSLKSWFQTRRTKDYKAMNGKCVYQSKWSLSLDPERCKRKFSWAKSGNYGPTKNIISQNEAPSLNYSPQQTDTSESDTSTGCSRNRSGSSSSKRHRKKTLSPSKDPFLMTPETLKEAVFKLCVAKLKKDKLISKNLDPDIWIGLDPVPSVASDPDYDTESENTVPDPRLATLSIRPFNLLLTKLKYTPPQAETVVEDEEVEPYNEHKEKLWEYIVKHRKNKSLIRKVTKTSRPSFKPKGEQTKLNSFFKLTTLNKRNDRDNYTARAKRRKIETSDEANTKKSKVTQENEYEPFPFKRSPYQTPHPSREQTPESFPLSSSPTKPENIPEPLPPKTLSVESPIKKELESEGTPEKHESPPKVSASPSTVYRCYYCEDKFSKMSIRMDHMRNVHSNRVKGWDGTKTGRGTQRSTSSEIVDIEPELKDEEDEEDDEDEVEVIFTGQSPVKNNTSLRRTARKTSSAASFKPMPTRESSSDASMSPRKTRKSTSGISEIKELKTNSSKPRGRPRKSLVSEIKEELKSVSPKPRGRPRKTSPGISEINKELKTDPPKARGRPRKRGKKKAPKCDDENYDELTIEVSERKEETEESADEEVEFLETIFAVSPKAEEKKRRKKGYDWSENEVFSLIEFYSLNPYLWDDSCKYESNEDKLIQRLERKLDIPVDRITSKWKSLMSRYKVEKYNSGSDWRYLSSLNFLEEVNLTSCPEDVSPLFSLLTGADSQNEDDNEASDEHDNSMNESKDIFPNLSDNDVIEDDDNESKSSDTAAYSTPFPDEESSTSVSYVEEPSSTLLPEEDNVQPLKISNSFKSRKVASSPAKVTCIEEDMLSPVKSSPANIVSPSGEESCRCEECESFFSTRGKLMQHKLKLRYFCCHCSKNFTSVFSLKQHQDNVDVSMHVCPFCKMFRNEESKHTVRHISENHVKQWISTECLKCKALFKNKEKTLAHIRQKHSVAASDCEDFIRVRDFRCLYDKDC
ncbi:uncharacterized protein LOC134823782 isoform X2 [Bolinopsis microptera]|uniref:uncharacterized protein LOC134823782 isoform X1 n=1 Tax=Bolinopsis microptera TaxID=2820187 RepID=UPI003078ACC7